MLASVRDVHEAQIVLDAGVEVIDLKQPSDGALGALPPDVIRAVVRRVGGRAMTSATAGNIGPDAVAVQAAMAAVAETGVDIVKAGLFPAGWEQGGRDYDAVQVCLGALAALPGVRRVAVMFADLAPPSRMVDAVADAGFDGVMVDTAFKQGHSLCDVVDDAWLAEFVARARARGLMCGLAGSLRIGHVGVLAAHAPDYLGFRSALCAHGRRVQELDGAAVAAVRRALLDAQPAPCGIA
ncbi:MAG TPA: (5-formylfuran-3-yl)methyl phosphate synthase [Methyloversatilis sp.]